MGDQLKPSLANRIITPLIFLLGGIFAIFWFARAVCALFEGGYGEVKLVDKGSYYLFGVGLGMLALALVIIWEQWLKRPLSKQVTRAFSGLAITSFALLIILPNAIHFCADKTLKNNGYSVCEEASHQWLFVRKIVYVKESYVCTESVM